MCIRDRVNDAELSAEEHGGFCTPTGQLMQSGTAPTRQNQRERLATQPADKSRVLRVHTLVLSSRPSFGAPVLVLLARSCFHESFPGSVTSVRDVDSRSLCAGPVALPIE